ncbi:hypothetical protein SPRG_14776 [Saprolegnia parasitica CBS 223.65]|uniref:Tim44-like domain-containing protein n=1 Tax=Saprolegnia parasitica (strain CBS 223.65) TaxID=695850 RepID=A0A067BYT7_SAPPC|nr:hypothetical protein SPRG_14776 [Saprolegnia parasitica CBS 223.65]KDO19697.1 hypothetical protein SPRG_14776 [Saprolegnia parasitica CBS 223.65]|eukprot:XP_012209613.1 hypothetical protein SPRG_14776 [Saprolegnia parasitica CBS 223.65]
MVMRRFQFHHIARRVPTLVPKRFASSSSPLPVAPPSALLRGLYHQVKSLLHFHELRHNLAPSLPARKKWHVCTSLQVLDEPLAMDEFLDGAKTAVDAVLHQMYSDAFRAYVADPSVMSGDVQWLQDSMSRRRFDACVFEIQEAKKRGMRYDLRHIRFANVAVFQASVANDIMQLQVHCDMVHTVRVTSGHRDFQVQKSSSMLWSFESPVDADQREWQIVDFHDIDLPDY